MCEGRLEEVQMTIISDDNYSSMSSIAINPGPEVVQLILCSTQLSMKFKWLVIIKIAKINENINVKSSKKIIFPASKC